MGRLRFQITKKYFKIVEQEKGKKKELITKF